MKSKGFAGNLVNHRGMAADIDRYRAHKHQKHSYGVPEASGDVCAPRGTNPGAPGAVRCRLGRYIENLYNRILLMTESIVQSGSPCSRNPKCSSKDISNLGSRLAPIPKYPLLCALSGKSSFLHAARHGNDRRGMCARSR